MPADNPWLPRINLTACTGCGDCVAACPVNALAQVGGKAALVRPDACTYCRVCEGLCPVEAIELPFLICTEDFLQTIQPRADRRDNDDQGSP